MSVRVDARVMPNLDAFDEEFGRERLDIDPPSKTGFRISTVIGLALVRNSERLTGQVVFFAMGLLLEETGAWVGVAVKAVSYHAPVGCGQARSRRRKPKLPPGLGR